MKKKLKKKLLGLVLVVVLLFGCAGQQTPTSLVSEPVKADITITIVQEGDAVAIKATSGSDEKIVKGMEIKNPGLELSQFSAISGKKLFVKIFSGISVGDVTSLWNDLIYLENETDVMTVDLFIDSPGGDAFSGLALADQIEKYKKKGFYFTAHGTGIIASAAVPVFAVCNETHATPATIFMVHEAALWKWPGRETASDIRSQQRLMELLQRLYLTKMVENSNKTFDEWVDLERKTSWFDRDAAYDMGILDIKD
jgi:ATP-dependent protease ClpP protease subunit